MFGLAMLEGLLLTACDFKMPKPPPDLFYKFNTVEVGQGPSFLVSADLDLDGLQDIVSANSKNSTVTILYSKGDGTFQHPMTLNVFPEPSAIAVGDMNRDGIPDLAINARGSDCLTLILSASKGYYYPPLKLKTGRVPLSVILDDFNNDSHLDLAVTLTFDKMEIHMGRGDGRFTKGETYLTGSRSFSGVSGDFDGDGNKDIALAASSSNASSVRLFTGNGDGTFRKPTQFAEGLVPLTLIKKDMNGDGLEDLLAATGKGDNLFLFYSAGDGSFNKSANFSAGGGPISLVANHFDDDDLPDVAVANSRSSNFSLVVRRPDGSFKFPTRDYIVTGGTPLAITSADYNDDGLNDIAVASNALNTVEIYLRRRLFR